MRKIEYLTHKRWNKMFRLWKRRKLDTPLEELVTYYNSMSHGHAFYFKQFKGNSLEVLRHLWILKEYLPEEHYNNLKEAFELFSTIKDKELTPYEEETFLKYDEIYFLDNYFLHLILWDLLTYNPYLIEPFNEKKAYRILRKIKSNKC